MRGDVKNSVGTVMRVTLGLMTCLAISFGLLTLISALTVSGEIGESQTAKLIPIVWGLSGLFGTLIGKKDRETNKWLSAYVLGGYAGVLFTCGMLAFEGALHRPWLPLICIFIGYLLSSELKKGASKKRKRHSAAR